MARKILGAILAGFGMLGVVNLLLTGPFRSSDGESTMGPAEILLRIIIWLTILGIPAGLGLISLGTIDGDEV
jgi:hypothetical protein